MKPDVSDYIDLLRCPVTGFKLKVAPEDLLQKLREKQAAGRLVDQSGKMVAVPPATGLVREDAKMFYPIRDGIPVLVMADGIALDFAE